MSFDGGVPQTWGDREGQRCGYVVVFAVGQRNEDPDVALRDDINIHKCHTFLDKALFQDMYNVNKIQNLYKLEGRGKVFSTCILNKQRTVHSSMAFLMKIKYR